MRQDVQEMLRSFDFNPTPNAQTIEGFLDQAESMPDTGYMDFMRQHDGGEGAIGSTGYLIIWPFVQVLKNTKGYRADEIRKGLLLFATDGGDKAYAFDRSDPAWPIVTVSLSSASPEDVQTCAKNFTEFLEQMANELR